MGYNIAGIVISDNFNRDIRQLENELKYGIEIIEEVSFETASSNWTPDDEFRLHFTDKATLIFFPHKEVYNIFGIPSKDSMSYAYSATAMAFELNVYRNGKPIREISENSEQGRTFNRGEKLEIEDENESTDSLIFKLIDLHLNESFYGIDLNAISFRCKKTAYNPQKQKAEPKDSTPINVELKESSQATNVEQKNKVKKAEKWWVFWK